ncbi:MAG TPA: fused MFS/spermidine synthase [Acidobacteriaceae bacterium]|nr:fused MFS/spermidine synthase [Acidobacteriaceae bacterium]
MPVSRGILYGAAIFLGAFLLFAVEPMAAKRLLPALGGSSAVWITCLVFFQTALLLGYAYAHALTKLRVPGAPFKPGVGLSGPGAPSPASPLRPARIWRTERGAGLLHIALLAAAVLLLILLPQPNLSSASTHPVTAIFSALSLSIGLPFLLLASTSPLLQVWMAREQTGRIPWRLFALSNAGSLLALLLYPSLIEPHLALPTQRLAWIAGFILYALLCTAIAGAPFKPDVGLSRPGAPSPKPADTPSAPCLPQLETWDSTKPDPTDTPGAPFKPSSGLSGRGRTRLLWFLIPAAASIQLSAVTQHITQNIAAIPLLWIIPLAIYLLTFILAFEIPALYRRWIIVRLLIVLLAALGWFLTQTGVTLPILLTVGFFVAEMFFACWFCHAETYALRPAHASEATLFYLLIAAGGAAGAFFIGILCPLLFDANYDIALAFFLTAAVALFATWTGGWQARLLWSAATAGLFALVIMLHIANGRSLLQERNFYGTLRVTQTNAPMALTIRTLTHGTVTHGTQWFAPDFRRTPTTYYAPDSGIGLALDVCCGDRPRNIGVVGLGAGTIAAYGRPGDRITFYEINPSVPPIARNLFTYLRDSPARISIVLGDARLSLAAQPPQHFDVLAIDAFSGDAIPMHLLTTQAMDVYKRQLTPNGILAFHVSNQFLDLAPEVAALALASGMEARYIDTPANDSRGEFEAQWVLVSASETILNDPEIFNAADPMPEHRGLYPWTDNRSSLLPILRWKVTPRPH